MDGWDIISDSSLSKKFPIYILVWPIIIFLSLSVLCVCAVCLYYTRIVMKRAVGGMGLVNHHCFSFGWFIVFDVLDILCRLAQCDIYFFSPSFMLICFT